MKNQKLRLRKLAKSKSQRRRYEYVRNLNKNVPSVVVEEKHEVYRSKTENKKQVFEDGQPVVEHVGYKTVLKKEKRPWHHVEGDKSKARTDEYNRNIGMAFYTKRRKHMPSKVALTK